MLDNRCSKGWLWSGAGLAILISLIAAAPLEARSRYRVPTIGHINEERLLNADKEPDEWLTSGRDWRQSYYSPLTKIHKSNIGRLGYAWSHDIRIETALASTPIVVDGTMFTSGNRGKVYALDARSGQVRWSFEPRIDPSIVNCCAGINRGVAVWAGKVYVAALDAHLYALDAATGEVIWKVDTVIDRSRSYSSTGAPYIAGERVVIGNSGAEYDTRGYISAYELANGKFAWRFFIVPGDPKKGFEHPELEKAATTWDANSLWELGLGGNAWDGMAYDPQLGLLYVGTGNGLPWSRKLRSPGGGDNLFLSSILAINPRTGRLIWHYQTTPGDNWDFNAAQKMILAELNIRGESRKVLMQAAKNGFFYVLDRETGQLISAQPYVYTNWADSVDAKTGRPVETGKADYSEVPRLVFPTNYGGHNWQPMSFNPVTHLVYIPTLEAGEVYGNVPGPFQYQKRTWNNAVIFRVLDSWKQADVVTGIIPEGWPSADALRGSEPDPTPRTFLKAWNPVEQKLVWQVETTGPVPDPKYDRRSAGVMTTAAGLVFQGDVSGHLRVFDATSGAQLHSVDVGTSMLAAPMSYAVGEEQYVAIMAGVHGQSPLYVDYKHGTEGRIIAFKLGGRAVRKRRPKGGGEDSDVSPPPISDVSESSPIRLGQKLFDRNCSGCHATLQRAPDLALMAASDHEEFDSIVLGGSRAENGMPSYAEVLTQHEVNAIHTYLIRLAWEKYRRRVLEK